MVQPLCAGCVKDDSIEIIKRWSKDILEVYKCNSILRLNGVILFFDYVRFLCFLWFLCFLTVQRNYWRSVGDLSVGKTVGRETAGIEGWTDETPMRGVDLFKTPMSSLLYPMLFAHKR